MSDIKFHKDIEFVSPVMIAGWPGMGSVALGAVDYLHKKLNAEKFAEIQIDPLVGLDSVIVENGLARLPEPPRHTFYYVKKPELIIFEGDSQLAGQSGIALLNEVLDVASRSRVKMIYTAAAFPFPVSHKEISRVYGAANKKSLTSALVKTGAKLMEDGQISGLNGLLLGFARERNIDAICLLATMPQYAISLPNPKASGAIIEILARRLNFEVDMHELNELVRDMDEKMALIEEKMKDVLAIERQEAPSTGRDKKPPAYIMEKIEKLFHEVKSDKTKAIMLKKELDRWDLYKAYEDRFLDLFKANQ